MNAVVSGVCRVLSICCVTDDALKAYVVIICPDVKALTRRLRGAFHWPTGAHLHMRQRLDEVFELQPVLEPGACLP